MDIVRLRSGREVTIRPIRPDDGARLQAAYDRLSPTSKYRRFLSPKPRLTTSDVRYLVNVDGVDHFALVATPKDDPHFFLGVARFVRIREDHGMAELAIVVGDPFQREGLGLALVASLARAAEQRGIGRFRSTLLIENVPADRLVHSAATGVVRERFAGPVKEIEIELRAHDEASDGLVRPSRGARRHPLARNSAAIAPLPCDVWHPRADHPIPSPAPSRTLTAPR